MNREDALMYHTPFMKFRTIVITLALGSSFLLVNEAIGQDPSTLEKRQTKSLDSLAEARNEQAKNQKATDAQTLSDLKTDKSDTKREAKEAHRVEENAANSAKESKSAYKTEEKAQKARRKADAQAKKAAKAKNKE
jgi:hypothetical protein